MSGFLSFIFFTLISPMIIRNTTDIVKIAGYNQVPNLLFSN